MVVLWLVGLIGVGIIFIGLRFLLDPAAGAIGFGVPVPPSDAYAYLLAKGTRDVASGLFVLAFLLFGWQRPLSALIGIATLIPVGDFITVLNYTRGRAKLPLLIHAGTALYMAVVAVLLWSTSAPK